jgi:hypothetical protein
MENNNNNNNNNQAYDNNNTISNIFDSNDIIPNSSYYIYDQDNELVKYYSRDGSLLATFKIGFIGNLKQGEQVKDRLDPKTKGKAQVDTIKICNSVKSGYKTIKYLDKHNNVITFTACEDHINTLEQVRNYTNDYISHVIDVDYIKGDNDIKFNNAYDPKDNIENDKLYKTYMKCNIL